MGTALEPEGRTDSGLHDSSASHLEGLISRLEASADQAAELLVEHLQTAQAYFLGAMPEECAVNLDMARNAAAGLSDESLRRDVLSLLDQVSQNLQSADHRAIPLLLGHPRRQSLDHEPPATAIGLAEFFHGADVKLGTFYPVQHVVAIFPTWERALEGQRILQEAGLHASDVLAVPGPEVATYLTNRRTDRGFWARVVTGVSRILDTEAVLVDHYIEWGRQGEAFLIAYGRTESAMGAIPELLKPLQPTAMHGFMISYVRHLT